MKLNVNLLVIGAALLAVILGLYFNLGTFVSQAYLDDRAKWTNKPNDPTCPRGQYSKITGGPCSGPSLYPEGDEDDEDDDGFGRERGCRGSHCRGRHGRKGGPSWPSRQVPYYGPRVIPSGQVPYRGPRVIPSGQVPYDGPTRGPRVIPSGQVPYDGPTRGPRVIPSGQVPYDGPTRGRNVIPSGQVPYHRPRHEDGDESDCDVGEDDDWFPLAAPPNAGGGNRREEYYKDLNSSKINKRQLEMPSSLSSSVLSVNAYDPTASSNNKPYGSI